MLELGASGRILARVRLGLDERVSVLQPDADGSVWVEAGVWDPGALTAVEVASPGGARLDVSIDGTPVFSGTTLGSADEPPKPMDILNVRAAGAVASIDNIQIIRSTCAADFEGDGAVDVRDLAIMLSAWGESGPAYLDLSGSGVVDIHDLGSLLASWGACD